jgi:anti-sigma regulatory factor (Ser/Thr protein kinase)
MIVLSAQTPTGHPGRDVHRTDRAAQLREILPELSAALAARNGADDGRRLSLRICLDELSENVVFHAGDRRRARRAARRRPRRVEIGIADLGVGIRHSLRHNPAYAAIEDDLAATITTLQPQVSATPRRNGGLGLAVARVLVETNQGILHIRSGHASVTAGAVERRASTTLHVPGTLVGLRVRTDRPFEVGAAYEALEDHFHARLRQRGLDDDDAAPG